MTTSGLHKISLAVTLMLLTTSAVAGQYWSGNNLVEVLEKDMGGTSDFDVGIATGYIMGVADAMEGSMICAPNTMTVKQAKQVVFDYMKGNPEIWNLAASTVVTRALRNAWPCPDKK